MIFYGGWSQTQDKILFGSLTGSLIEQHLRFFKFNWDTLIFGMQVFCNLVSKVEIFSNCLAGQYYHKFYQNVSLIIPLTMALSGLKLTSTCNKAICWGECQDQLWYELIQTNKSPWFVPASWLSQRQYFSMII